MNRLTLHALHNYQENQLREFKERLIRAEGDNDMCKIPLPRTAHIYGNDIEQSQENAKQFVDIWTLQPLPCVQPLPFMLLTKKNQFTSLKPVSGDKTGSPF